ncbi:MAG: hypothetical protein PVG78_15880 [Desulfobacterales bacterium]|jgi:hypothetical protein
MSRLEKRLIAGALVFVVIYLGAAALTIQHRMTADRDEARFESAEPLREERHLMMAELLLPMLILFAVAFSYLLLKKKREKVAARMDEEKDLEFDGEWREAGTAEKEQAERNA